MPRLPAYLTTARRSGRLRRAREILHEGGPAELAARAFAKVASLWRPRTMVFLRLDLERLPVRPPGPFRFEMPSVGDLQNESCYFDGWATADEAAGRLQDGHRLFVVREEGEIVCCAWGETGRARVRFLNLEFTLPANVAYQTGVFTVPAMRNRGLAYNLRLETAHYWRLQGCEYLIVVVDPRNTASLKLQRKLGYERYQTIEYRRLGWLRVYRVERDGCRESRRFVSFGRGPLELWKTFWPGAPVLTARRGSRLSDDLIVKAADDVPGQ